MNLLKKSATAVADEEEGAKKKKPMRKAAKQLIAILVGAGIFIGAVVILKFLPKTPITYDSIRGTLSPISELNTAVFDYGNKSTRGTSRGIPGTSSSVTVTYHGVIKIGYDADVILDNLERDEKQKTITVYLPEPEIYGNYIDTQNLIVEESNSILNPLHVEDFVEYLKSFQEEGMEKAKEDGLYRTAREKIETVIRGLLGVFPEYEVRIMDLADKPVTQEATEPAETAAPTEVPEATDAPEAEQTEKPAA